MRSDLCSITGTINKISHVLDAQYLLNLHVCGREASEKELRKNMKRMELSKIRFKSH